jgi:hypothetical protein
MPLEGINKLEANPLIRKVTDVIDPIT